MTRAILAAMVLATVGVNLWWLATNRRGYPFDIDESGYLSRALTDGELLRNEGIRALAVHVHGPDPQAPLLPVTAGVVHAATGVGPVGMMAIQQLFYAVLLVSTFFIAKHLGGRVQALVATAMVGACPGLIDTSRSFGFGLVAAAMVTATLAVQLWAGTFDRWPRALAWGVVLGLAALSRTMVLGVLPGLVLAAGIRVSAPGRRTVRVTALAGGLLVGFAVAWSWYSASWRNVEQYLSSFGYGAAAASYGKPLSVLSLGWWIARADTLVNSTLLAPLAVAVVACLVVALVMAVHWYTAGQDGAAVGVSRSSPSRVGGVVGWLRGDSGTVFVVLAWSYLALSSTSNIGSGFVYVLAPPLIVLSVAAVSCALDRHRGAQGWAMTALAVVAAASFVADSWPVATSGPVTVSLAGSRVQVVNDEGTLRAVLTGDVPDQHLSTATVDRELHAEVRAAQTIADLVERGETPGSPPTVVALATSDQFVNVNSVGLDLQEMAGAAPEVTLLYNPGGAVTSLARQVSEVGVVVVGPNSPLHRLRNFLTVTHPMAVVPLLPAAGFHRVGSVGLPDGRVLQVWAKE